MFERYTEAARRALFFARYEASQNGSMTIETEHLLLGLLREDHGPIVTLLSGVDRAEVERLRGASNRVAANVEIPFSADTKSALRFAGEEAERLLHNHIGSEHLLLGLLRLEECAAAKYLVSRGLTLNVVRERIVQLRQEPEIEREQRRPLETGRRHFVDGGTVHSERLKGGTSFEALMVLAKRSDGGGQRGMPGSLSFESTPLEQLIASLCDCQRERIDLPEGMDGNQRYDLVITHSPDVSDETRKRLLMACLEVHLKVTVTRENRSADAYVLTAPKGAGPGLKPLVEEYGGGFGHASMDFVTGPSDETTERAGAGIADLTGRLGAFRTVSAAGITMAVLASMLESMLGKPVVEETGLTGFYEVNATSDSQDMQDMQESLRQLLAPLGLVLTPAPRDIEMVIVRRQK